MPSKLLLAAVLMVVVIGVYLYTVLVGNQVGSRSIDEGITQLTDVGICGMNAFNNDCSRWNGQLFQGDLTSTDEAGNNCLYEKSGSLRSGCQLCEGEVPGGTLYVCKVAVCGCGWGYRETKILVFVDKNSKEDPYGPGDDIEITGKLMTDTLGGSREVDVKISFLDSDRKLNAHSLYSSSEESFTVRTDDTGRFKFIHKLPSESESGTYFVLAEYDKTNRGFRQFMVENPDEFDLGEAIGNIFKPKATILGQREVAQTETSG